MAFKPHRWQTEAVQTLDTILVPCDHAYLQAPTGVGKTYAIIMHGEQSPIKGYRVIIIGTDQITKQHRDTLIAAGFKAKADNDFEYVSSATKQTWIVETWQAISRNPAKYKRRGKCGLLYFDECHLGGSNAANTSYAAIVDALKPAKRLMVSATTNVVSEKLLGVREAHSYIYTMSEAYQDDLLNPVDIVEVQTGLTAEIRRIESIAGQPMDDIEEMKESSLQRLAEALKAKKVAAPDEFASSVRKIVDYRHQAMIDRYLSNHKEESAIFWSPTIEAAERAAVHYGERTGTKGLTVHSKLGAEAEDRIIQFRQGNQKVVFAVAMLQEGFDMPELAVSFDCRFHRQINKNRIARMLQRIGRLTRKLAGKPRSRYYIAPDLTHYYSKNGAIKGSVITASLLAAGDVLTDRKVPENVTVYEGDDVELNRSVTDDEIAGALGVDKSPGVVISKVETAKISPLYVIESVRDYIEHEAISLGDLFRLTTEQRKNQFLMDALSGKQKPSSVCDVNEYALLGKYQREDSEFKAAIIEASPDWAISDNKDPQVRMAKFLADAKSGKKHPSSRGDTVAEYLLLRKYQRENPEFDAAIVKANPSWRVDRDRDPFVHKTRLLEEAKAGKSRPTTVANIKDYNRLQWYFTKDAEFKAAIIAANPAWAFRTILSDEELRAKNLADAKAGMRRPRWDDPNYKPFMRDMDDPEYAAAIIAANPTWKGNAKPGPRKNP